MKANQRTLHRSQIRSQFQGKRKIPFVAAESMAAIPALEDLPTLEAASA